MTAAVLPSRAGYLVREGSDTGFRRAVQEACTRWGGVSEPIIPVKDGGEVDAWWRRLWRWPSLKDWSISTSWRKTPPRWRARSDSPLSPCGMSARWGRWIGPATQTSSCRALNAGDALRDTSLAKTGRSG